MKDIIKFKKINPETNQEKLMCELLDSLHGKMMEFFENNFNAYNKEVCLVLRDSSLALAGETIEILSRTIKDKSHIYYFINEARNIFECYMSQIERDQCDDKSH